ncbi:MAG: response regulator transcription factor [Bacteroidetes bacterium]|nr:response regulator transcription factor [Bacteroidota bacterium]
MWLSSFEMHSEPNLIQEIVVADGHTLTALGLKYHFQNTGKTRIQQVTEKNTLFSLVNAETSLIIIDYLTMDGFKTADLSLLKTRHPEVPILIFTDDKDKDSILSVLETGVSGLLFKDCFEDEIVRAVNSIITGEKFFCNKVFDLLMESRRRKQTDCFPTTLTSREVDIIKLVVSGKSTTAIADNLNLSPHTVSTHRKNILRKLKIKSPVELVTYAYDLGLISSRTPSSKVSF